MNQRVLRFRVDEPKIAVEDFDGEFVVLNLETGQYFCFAEAGALVWKGLAAGLTIDELTAAIEATSTRLAEIHAFVEQIAAAGLIIEAPGRDIDQVDDLATELAQHAGELAFEAFDDLAALLVADPIHDVEREAGWPHTAPA